MIQNKDMDYSKRLSLLEEFLSSTLLKTTLEKGKGLAKGSISRWLISFAIEDKPTIVKVASPMSKANDKTELLNPDDEIVRLRQEHKIKELELKRATMARDAYERMIVIAEEKYAIPIRKSSGSQSAPRRKRHRRGQRPH